LLDGSLKSVLDEEKTAKALRKHSVAGLGDEGRLIMLHDPCDIRKEYSEKLEKIGTVRDLDGRLINGYCTFNTVGIDVKGKQLYPVDTTVYSNGDEHYVRVKEMEKYERGKLQASDDQAERERARQIEQFIPGKKLPQFTAFELSAIAAGQRQLQAEKQENYVMPRAGSTI
jgi:hypothetical protein